MRGSDCLYACGFRIYFTPLPGFFSPFLHSTCSLSVDYEYLALEDGPPIFRQDYTCPALLVVRSVPPIRFRVRGYHPLWPAFPYRSTSQSTITYEFSQRYPCGWVSPFGHPRIKACLPAPRGLSQATTSFIACNRQGIHHMHLFT